MDLPVDKDDFRLAQSLERLERVGADDPEVGELAGLDRP